MSVTFLYNLTLSATTFSGIDTASSLCRYSIKAVDTWSRSLYSGRVLSYPLHMLSEKEKRYALDERRPKGMSWLYMKPFSNS